MKKLHDGLCVNFMVFMVLLFLMISCTGRSAPVGKWQEIGRSATIEFFKDGTFKAVDNQGMAVEGRYGFDSGSIRFDITRQGLDPERVKGNCSLKDGLLTLTSEDGKEVDRYQRYQIQNEPVLKESKVDKP